jgi:hypothetical protein
MYRKCSVYKSFPSSHHLQYIHVYGKVGFQTHQHVELLGFWTFSIVWYSREHDVSETGSVSVLRWWGRRHLLSWATQKELISITGHLCQIYTAT